MYIKGCRVFYYRVFILKKIFYCLYGGVCEDVYYFVFGGWYGVKLGVFFGRVINVISGGLLVFGKGLYVYRVVRRVFKN